MARAPKPPADGFRAEILAGVLAAATARVAVVVPSRNTIPVIGHCLLRAEDGGKLMVAATNLDQGLAVTVDATALGGITVPAAKLAAIAAHLPPDQPVVMQETDSGSLTVSCGRSVFKLPTLPADTFPESSVAALTDADALTWSVDGLKLAGHLKALEGTVSREEIRFYLCGIFLDLDSDAPAMAATNGNSLGVIDITDMAPPRHPGLILPLAALRPIGEIAKSSTSLVVGISHTAMTFEAGGIRLRTKMIEGTYPNYRNVVPPHDQPSRVTVDTAQFNTAIQRAMLVQPDPVKTEDGKAKAKGRWSSMHVDVGEAEILLAARNNGGESVSEVCPCSTVKGQGLQIAASGIYLAWAIHSLGVDTVDIAMSDPGTPILIHASGDTASLRVVMPQRR